MEPISLSQGRLRAPLLRLQSDERLARLAADGNSAALDVLVRRHRPALLRACTRVLPDGRAEDAVQQGLLSAQQALKRNGPPERFEPWLHRIAVNAALKELQRTPPDLPLDEERVDGVEQPAERFERRERLRSALAAIAALPEGQRRALVMRELEGRSHAEIAGALGLTAGAARQLIHRARGTMRSAASALTPYGLLARMGGGEAPSQTAEIVAGGGAAAFTGKALATLVLAGGIVGGTALVPHDSEQPAKVTEDSAPSLGVESAEGAQTRAEPGERRGPGDDNGPGSRRSDESEDRSGSDGDDEPDDDSGSGGSGSGDGDGDGEGEDGGSEESESSGSGSGSSGSGGGSGSSGSGSGEDGSEDPD